MPLSLRSFFCTPQKRKRPLDRVIKKLISGYYYPETESGKRNGVPKRGSIDRIIEKRKGKLGRGGVERTDIPPSIQVLERGVERRQFPNQTWWKWQARRGGRFERSIRSIRLTSPVIGDFSTQRAAAAPKMCTPEKSSAAAFMSRCLFKKKFMIKKKILILHFQIRNNSDRSSYRTIRSISCRATCSRPQ